MQLYDFECFPFEWWCSDWGGSITYNEDLWECFLRPSGAWTFFKMNSYRFGIGLAPLRFTMDQYHPKAIFNRRYLFPSCHFEVILGIYSIYVIFCGCNLQRKKTYPHEIEHKLGGGFKYLLFSTLPGEMIQFD